MTIDWNAVGVVGTWFSGVATLCAVVIALRLQRMYERRDRPSLSVTLKPESNECLRYMPPEFASAGDDPRGQDSAQLEELWLRVCLNNSGGAAARDVEVRLLEILREGGDVAESRGSLWFKVGNLNSISARMLPKGINQHFDIAFVVHDLASQNSMSFHLALVPPLFLDKPQLGGSWADLKKQMETDTTNRLDVGRKYTLRIVAYLIPMGNVPMLTTAIASFCADKVRRQRMMESSYKSTRDWIWEKVARQHLDVLHEAMLSN